MLYKFWRWVFERYEHRFRPRIPEVLLKLGQPFRLDINIVRWSGKRLSVNQVDEMLERDEKLCNDYLNRLAVKNMLVALQLMDEGQMRWEDGVLGNRVSIGGQKFKLWRNGLSLRYSRLQRWQARGGWLQYRYQAAVVLWDQARKYLDRVWKKRAGVTA